MENMQRHFHELDELGYTTLEDLLTSNQVEEAIVALEEVYESEKNVVSLHEPKTKRTFNFTSRAEISRQIIQIPRLVACMEYLLESDYILSDMGARSPMKGVSSQGLHRDGGTFIPNPSYNVHSILPLAAQPMFALSEFTANKGATRFVPGSHISNIDPTDVTPEEKYLFTCQPGTVLICDNRLVHGDGTNTTDEIRYSVQGFCCRKYIKPFCDHTRSIP